MPVTEFYNDMLIEIAGSAAYDGLGKYLQSWKSIILPKAKTENEVVAQVEMLLQAAVQNIDTQNIMLQQLRDIAQTVQGKTQSFKGNNMVNNFGTVEKQVNNPTVQGDFNM